MTWQSTLTWEDAQNRAEILDQIRAFFKARKVIEVETPALSQGTITDVHLEALSCNYNFMESSSISQSTTLYLQTSPEFHMKRLLASGYQSIYQMAKAFRHESAGRFHNPEFTLLEWYRIDFDHFDLIKEVSALLKEVLACEEPRLISYQAVFKEYTNIDPLNTNRKALLSYVDNINKLENWIIQDSLNDEENDMLLQYIFTECVEPNIGITSPCFVYDFPLSQASLAKVSTTDPRVANRFECYFKGFELANGFNELTDANIQRQRFSNDNKKRKALGLCDKAIDQNFIEALSNGIPECAGVALGVDRLVMLALEKKKIDDVISFGVNIA